MRTAIDSSVLVAILTREPGYLEWQHTLENASMGGSLLISSVAFAEISPFFESSTALLTYLKDLAIQYDELRPESAWLAGRLFKAYRQGGGPRTHIIPDFLIAAHAQVQADRLASGDRGYLRRYFSELPRLAP